MSTKIRGAAALCLAAIETNKTSKGDCPCGGDCPLGPREDTAPCGCVSVTSPVWACAHSNNWTLWCVCDEHAHHE